MQYLVTQCAVAEEVGEGMKDKGGGGGKGARTRAAAAQDEMQVRIKGIPGDRHRMGMKAARGGGAGKGAGS